MKGRPRPISLKTDVIKQRNRLKAVDRRHQSRDSQPDAEPPRRRPGSSSPAHRRQSTRSRDPARGSANARKSDPGGVLDAGTRTPESDELHVDRSKRRKDVSQTSSDSPSHPPLLGHPKTRLTCILHPEDHPSGSLRTQSLAGVRPTSAHMPRLGLSLGSPRDFSFDLRPVSLDQLSRPALASDTAELPPASISHGLVPARRIPPPDLLSFSVSILMQASLPSPCLPLTSPAVGPIPASPIAFRRPKPNHEISSRPPSRPTHHKPCHSARRRPRPGPTSIPGTAPSAPVLPAHGPGPLPARPRASTRRALHRHSVLFCDIHALRTLALSHDVWPAAVVRGQCIGS